MNFQRILLATDFSESSSHAFCYAVLLARGFSSEILLLHVVQPPPPLVPGLDLNGGNLLDSSASMIEIAQARMGALIEEKVPLGIAVTLHCREGLAYDEIIALASEQAVDLIVLGTHGHTGLSHVLLGSVAEKVVRHARCPVLTVRHPGFGE